MRVWNVCGVALEAQGLRRRISQTHERRHPLAFSLLQVRVSLGVFIVFKPGGVLVA